MAVRTYTVREGDSLSAIADRELGHARLWPQLFAFNTGLHRHTGSPPLTHPDRLTIGQVLAIPPRVGSRPPHHARHARMRHPLQRTRPVVAPATAEAKPAGAATVQAGHPRPPKPSPGASLDAAAANALLASGTHVNSPAFKYDLNLFPPIKGAIPGFDYEIKFVGQIYLWADKQVDILTFTDKGAELAAKQQTDAALGRLIASEKITFDQKARKVTFENLLTANAAGSQLGVGPLMDIYDGDPRPGFRIKFTSDKLMGRYPPTMLYVAENLQITVDIRSNVPPSGTDTAGEKAFASRSPTASDDLTFASRTPTIGNVPAGPVAGAAPTPGRAWWDHSYVLLPGAAVLVVGVLASNAITWGADTPADPVAFGAAGAMAARAFGH